MFPTARSRQEYAVRPLDISRQVGVDEHQVGQQLRRVRASPTAIGSR
jgi:hypothetical protein